MCGLSCRCAIVTFVAVRKVHVVRNNLRRAAFVAVLIRPVTHLQTAFHEGLAAFGEVPGNELTGLPPCHYINEIRLAFAAGLILEIPLDCEGEGRNRCPCVCVAQLGVSRKPPHKYDVIEHLYTSYK